jgi:hypothetical protein
MVQADDEIQQTRARQYAICTYALRTDGVSDGAEAIFDQALTNGLAAIVAHAWPGDESSGSRIRSAAGLLNVIKRRGKVERDGAIRVLHDPNGPEYAEPLPFEDAPVPNFTIVEERVLRGALDVTQAIRHARANERESDAVVTDEHMAALAALDYHPALFGITDELIERARENAHDRDATERKRARAYYRILDSAEQKGRAALDYCENHQWQTKDARSVVETCPVCMNQALVAREFDAFTEEIGIGTCHVCSYCRSAEIADEYGVELNIERAIQRAE